MHLDEFPWCPNIAGGSLEHRAKINIRPVHLFPHLNITLRDKKPAEIDFVQIRENTEGEDKSASGRLPDSIPFQISPNVAPWSGSSCQSDDLLHLPHLYAALMPRRIAPPEAGG